jgi:hypothetical protein
MTEAERVGNRPQDDTSAEPRGYRILVVDDEDDFCDIERI